MKTAVVFLVFNRPELTRRVLAAIREARPPVLFVVADGPRAGRAGEAEKCAEVRAVVEAGVDWPCEVRRNFSASNLGCARRVASGLNWVFEQVEEAIILEDDCLPDATFFPFCEELLERYREDGRVAQVAGCSFLPEPLAAERADYFFSRYPHCWGWATWRRAWRYYEPQLEGWRDHANGATWPGWPESRREGEEWSKNFAAVVEGRVDSWAYRWTATCWKRGLLSANIARNLVSNIGFGPEATHTRGSGWGELPTSPLTLPLRHPGEVARDVGADVAVGERVFTPSGWWTKVRRRWQRLFA